MHVRKFEADTLEEALKQIKKELGPDAIILKTTTNKGLKGAFKKKKIEITAAISEKNYLKKAHVDNVLNEKQKETFYANNSSYISNMIDEHATHRDGAEARTTPSYGYGRMGLNRTVKTTKEENAKDVPATNRSMKNDLDQFLRDTVTKETDSIVAPTVLRHPAAPTPKNGESEVARLIENALSEKIERLEKQVQELRRSQEQISKKEARGVFQLRNTLRSLEINEGYIQRLIRKLLGEMGEDDLNNPDQVFEVALNEMLKVIKTEMPLFSTAENVPAITLLLSDTSCGQTSMMLKLGSLKGDSILIKNTSEEGEESSSFAEKMFNISVVKTRSIAELVSECRKGIEQEKPIFIDFRGRVGKSDETKKIIEGLRRAFDNVEVLITLSAIHSGPYNRGIIARYRSLADGVVISNLDLCLNFGQLFNIAEEEPGLPFKFFGTGEVIPDDIEAATAERILAGMFKL